MSSKEDGKKDEGREGHLERTANEPRDADLHEVQLERIEQVNERVRLFRLRLLSGPVKFLPGQWLDTYIPGVPKAGGFTITSAPSSSSFPRPPSSSSSSLSEPPYFELAVQESPENGPAAWLWRPVGEILGERLRVRVGGRFVFPPLFPGTREKGSPAAAAAVGGDDVGDDDDVGKGVKKVVFVAGGVGVNPLVSMLSYIADNKQTTPLVDDVVFLYASKMPRSGKLSDILFLDRITRSFGEGKVQGRVKLFVTGGDDATSSPSSSSQQGMLGGTRTTIAAGTRREMNGTTVEVQKRRITSEDVEDAVGDGRDPGTVVYVCGPRGMTDELVERLAGFIDPRRVLTEKWW
ncbi:hypothetical protein TgHK011_000329 [Trichoderma gracile]|nr:hypothetical protein TgHK011_000329 [Trichoderma gracile]